MSIIKKYILVVFISMLLYSCCDSPFGDTYEWTTFKIDYISHTIPTKGKVYFDTYVYYGRSVTGEVASSSSPTNSSDNNSEVSTYYSPSPTFYSYTWKLVFNGSDISNQIVTPDPYDESKVYVDFTTQPEGKYTISVKAAEWDTKTKTFSMDINIADPTFEITATKQDIYLSNTSSGTFQIAALTGYIQSLMFKPVVEIDDIVKLDSGYNFVIAVDKTKKVFSKGNNNYGQLGLGDTVASETFKNIPGLTTIDNISTGYGHVLALADDGAVYSWGDNSQGQLGHGDTQSLKSPKEIVFLKDKDIVEVIAGGDFSMAVANNRTVYSWGSNDYGQLGHDNLTQLNAPIVIDGFKAKDIDLGEYHVVAIENSTKNLFAWGNNLNNRLGITTDITPIKKPTVISIPVDNAEKVAATNNYSIMINNKGRLYSWGFIRSDLELQTVPTQIKDPTGVVYATYNQTVWANRNSIILQDNKSKILYRWGNLLAGEIPFVYESPRPIDWILFNSNNE